MPDETTTPAPAAGVALVADAVRVGRDLDAALAAYTAFWADPGDPPVAEVELVFRDAQGGMIRGARIVYPVRA